MAKIGPPPENAGNQPSTLYSVGLSPVKTIFEAIVHRNEKSAQISRVSDFLRCWHEADGFF